MHEVTAETLREIVAETISPTIEIHRASRTELDKSNYTPPVGPPTDDEIDDFLCHNPLLDEETLIQLIDPGLLGFAAKHAKATDEWLVEFKKLINDWANNESWLAADEHTRFHVPLHQPEKSEVWTPSSQSEPAWVANAPSCVLLTADLLNHGRLLSEMSSRDFEHLIGALLEAEGWSVEVTQGTRDGGIDVVATKSDPIMGKIRSVWQAKKYKSTNKVKLHEVRELSAVREGMQATKGFIVTTSSLTRDAIAWVKRDLFRLGYKEHDQIKEWFEGVFLG